MAGAELIGKVVQFRTGPGQPGPRGRIVAYCDAPSFIFITEDGTKDTWRADMVDHVVPDRCPTCDRELDDE